MVAHGPAGSSWRRVRPRVTIRGTLKDTSSWRARAGDADSRAACVARDTCAGPRNRRVRHCEPASAGMLPLHTTRATVDGRSVLAAGRSRSRCVEASSWPLNSIPCAGRRDARIPASSVFRERSSSKGLAAKQLVEGARNYAPATTGHAGDPAVAHVAARRASVSRDRKGNLERHAVDSTRSEKKRRFRRRETETNLLHWSSASEGQAGQDSAGDRPGGRRVGAGPWFGRR